MFEIIDDPTQDAVIKVIGLGGAGGNAVKHMIDNGVSGVGFYAVNTDAQDLRKLGPEITSLQIGRDTTRGLGAGADPSVGRAAAEEDKEKIVELIKGADMIFLAAGMGGGTGTGSAPVVAAIAKSLNILTVAVVTQPFKHENRVRLAEEGLAQLSEQVDTVIVVSNDKLSKILGSKVSLVQAFGAANDVLLGAVQGIADLITRTGAVNVDFADVQTIMLNRGNAMMGTGIASGESRAEQATNAAIRSPLLEDMALNSAKGLLVNVTADENMGMAEYSQICDLIKENYAAPDAQIVSGVVIDNSMEDKIKVTVVATGVFPKGRRPGGGPPAKQGIPLSSSHAVSANAQSQLPPVSSGSSSDQSSLQQPASEGRDEHATPAIPDQPASQKQQPDYERLRAPSFLRNQAN